ncbi:MAG TPA: hypothetical protein VLL52_00700 [Anaerolineae bacterium]|nr:hypothetical protein [Anaerolineae bacterium]
MSLQTEIFPLLQRLERQEKLLALQFLINELVATTSTQTDSTDVADLGWPPNFFAETFGSLQNVPLVREFEGDYEVREPLE